MARYAVAVNATATGVADAPMCSIHTAADYGIRIQEIWFSTVNGPGTSDKLWLVRPDNTPVASTSVLGQPEDPDDAVSVTNVDTAWSTAPTIGSTQPLRTTKLVQAGNFNNLAYLWREGEGLVVPLNGWLVVWQKGTWSSAFNALVTFVWDE